VDAETRTYLDDLRRAVETLADETHRNSGAIAELAQQTRRSAEAIESSAEETRRHFGVLTESLRADIKAVAEGVVGNTRAIAELRAEIYREIDGRFKVVELAIVDVRRSVEDVRVRLQ
jgi:cell division septum initiation protein DivIVA